MIDELICQLDPVWVMLYVKEGELRARLSPGALTAKVRALIYTIDRGVERDC
jgi:hypothetical protein